MDVANHFYCYSFEPHHDWSEHFCQRVELCAYLERCADEYGVRPHIRFETKVLGARWGEDSASWEVRLRGPDRVETTGAVNAVVSGVGQLNRPKIAVFQRSPAWMFPNPSYHRKVSDGKRWLLKHVPYHGRWYRFLLFWPGSGGLMPGLEVDPAWPHPERSVNATNDQMREIFTSYMVSQLGDAPELIAKVVPTYPPFVKRMLQDKAAGSES